MSRWRGFGLSLAFVLTLSGGILVSQPAQAFTLNAIQCARLGSAISYLEGLATKYPDSQLLAALLDAAKNAFVEYGCSAQ
jgi:hypothetical protein